jgi:hypothetical protein
VWCCVGEMGVWMCCTALQGCAGLHGEVKAVRCSWESKQECGAVWGHRVCGCAGLYCKDMLPLKQVVKAVRCTGKARISVVLFEVRECVTHSLTSHSTTVVLAFPVHGTSVTTYGCAVMYSKTCWPSSRRSRRYVAPEELA